MKPIDVTKSNEKYIKMTYTYNMIKKIPKFKIL